MWVDTESVHASNELVQSAEGLARGIAIAEAELCAAQGMLDLLVKNGAFPCRVGLRNPDATQSMPVPGIQRSCARYAADEDKENKGARNSVAAHEVCNEKLAVQLSSKAHEVGRLRALCEQSGILKGQLQEELQVGRAELAQCRVEAAALHKHGEGQLQNLHALEKTALAATAEDAELRSRLEHLRVERLQRKRMLANLTTQFSEQARLLVDAKARSKFLQQEAHEAQTVSSELACSAQRSFIQQEKLMNSEAAEHSIQRRLLEVVEAEESMDAFKSVGIELRKKRVEVAQLLKQEEAATFDLAQEHVAFARSASAATELKQQLQDVTAELQQQKLAQSMLQNEVDQQQKLTCEMRESNCAELKAMELFEDHHMRQTSEHRAAISKAQMHVAGLKNHIASSSSEPSEADESIHSNRSDLAAHRACRKEVSSTLQSAIRRLGVEKIVAQSQNQDDVELLSALGLAAAQEIRCEVQALLPHVLAVLRSGRSHPSLHNYCNGGQTVRTMLSELRCAVTATRAPDSFEDKGTAEKSSVGFVKLNSSPGVSQSGSLVHTPLSQYSAFMGQSQTERSPNSSGGTPLSQVDFAMGHGLSGRPQSPASVSSINVTTPSIAVECACPRCTNVSRSRISESSLDLSPSRLDFSGASG